MNETKSIIKFNTVHSVKKAISKIEIGSTGSKNDFDEIAISIKQIDEFYKENAGYVSPKILLKLHNYYNNVVPDYRAMILSFLVSIVALIFPYIFDELFHIENSIINLVIFTVAVIVTLILAVMGLGLIASYISSGNNQIVNDHHKEVLEQIIKKRLEEKCNESKEKATVSSSK